MLDTYKNMFSVDPYIAKIDHLVNVDIREYDIEKANISILFEKGIIEDEEIYNKYASWDKKDRNVFIGCMQRSDPKLKKIINDGYSEFVMKFVVENGISPFNVLSIKRDAVFLIDDVPKLTQFGKIKFREKNKYTSFYKLHKVEYYFYHDNKSMNTILDPKGLGEKAINLHKEYMLDFLSYVFTIAQTEGENEARNELKSFIERMKKYELNINFYRELNPKSLFKTKININNSSTYLESLDKNVKIEDIDPTHNINILLDLFGMYF